MIKIAEDFSYIAMKLKQIEEEKAKVLTVPLPDVQPVHKSYHDYTGLDYDPA